MCGDNSAFYSNYLNNCSFTTRFVPEKYKFYFSGLVSPLFTQTGHTFFTNTLKNICGFRVLFRFLKTITKMFAVFRNKIVIPIVVVVVLVVTTVILYFALHTTNVHGSEVLKNTKIIDFQNYMPSNVEEFLNGDVSNFTFSKLDLDGDKNNIYNGTVYLRATTNLLRLIQGQIGAQVWTIVAGCKNPLEITLNKIMTMNRFFDQEDIVVPKSVKEIESLNKNGKIAHMLSVEGVEPIKEYLTVLDAYKKLGVRSVSLKSNYQAEYCRNLDWSSSPKLDHFVAKMNQLGLVIDLAGSSVEIVDKVLNISKAPIVISHMSVNYFNTILHVLDKLKEKKGILLIPLHSDEKGSLQRLIGLIDRIQRKMSGCDNIALASGFDNDKRYNETLNNVSKMPSLFDALYEDDNKVWTPKCLEKFARGNLFELMKQVEGIQV